MKILISNDDGVFAPGILAAKQAVEDLADVTVVAPDENNSSVGRRITLFKHLKENPLCPLVVIFLCSIDCAAIIK